MSASLAGTPGTIGARPVFTAAGIVFTVADLVRSAGAGGREAVSTASPAPSSQAAEEQFRRARGLLRADQLEAWLASWEITPDDFRAWTEDAASGTTTASSWCTLLCSGQFEAVTAALVAAAAAACELGAPPTSATTFDPGDWVVRLLSARATPEALAAVVDAHRLDWTRLATVTVRTPSRAVAEELRHQVVSDGLALDAAASRARLDAVPADQALDTIASATLRSALAGARAGELIGPVRVEEGWALVAVLGRIDAALDDEATRARATAAVHAEVIGGAVARHVVA